MRDRKIRSGGMPTDSASAGVQPQPLVVAVHRQHVARAGQVEHQLHVLLVAVAGGVDRRVRGGDHAGADLEDPVDRLVDRALVAGHRRRREDDRVAGVELDVAVVAVRHPAQRRERLALAAGRDRDHLLVGEVLDLARLDQQAVGRVGDPEVGGDVEVLAHRAPDQRDLAVELGGGVDHLLDAVDVGGEAGDDDPALAAPERLQQRRADARLRGGDAGAVGVGRVAAEAEQALAAELGEPGEVGRDAVDRRLVELVVAGQQDRPDVGVERDRAGVGDRVGHVDHLDPEGPPASTIRPVSRSRSGTSRSLCSSSFERTIPIVSRPP